MTSNSPANAASGSANAAASGDVFAAMLDQLAQELTNGMATVPADAVSADAGAQGDATSATATPSNDAGASAAAMDPMLAQLLAAQQAAANPPPTITTTKPETESDAADDAADPRAKTDKPVDNAMTTASPDAGSIPQADPLAAPPVTNAASPTTPTDAQQPETADASASSAKADADASAKPAHDGSRPHKVRNGVEAEPATQPSTTASSDADPSSATAANTEANPAASVADAPAQPVTVTPADPVTVAAIAAATAAPVTDQAASSVVAKGTTAKPGKVASGVASNDSSKTEARSTKATALADAGDVSKRGFASEPAVRAAALSVPGKVEDAADNTASPRPAPQHNAANPTVIATPPQPDAAPIQQAEAPATPVHAAQAAPQVDPAVSIATVNAGTSPTQTPATPAHLAAQIQVTLHAPDVDSLAVTIAAKSQDGQKHFDIRLDPAELGRVDVRLTVDDAGKAQAMLTVEKPQTLELLQKDQSHLERALKDAGLDLTQNGLSFSLKGQQQQQQNAQDHTPFARGQRLAARAAAAVQDVTPTLSTSGIANGDARLDIRV